MANVVPCQPEAPSPPERKVNSPSLFSNITKYLRFSNAKVEKDKSVSFDDPDAIYFGVYIPCEAKSAVDEEKIHVYDTREEALKIVKKYKEARFKALHNKQEAVAFALRGVEFGNDKHIEGPSLVNGGTESKAISSPSLASPNSGEKPSAFKGPKPQDLVRLRRAIEAGLLSAVRDTVWDNPRYLVSSGDTPAILQEGCRYNAMHVAAKAKNAEMCNLILTTVGDPAFVQLLYGDDDIENSKDRAAILVDLYLNTPDKSLNETPLHFASKFGAVEVVELLVSFPQCNRDSKNKYGQAAKDIVCQRTDQIGSVMSEISRLLSERYYVPVLHTEDESMMPTIGMPFSTDQPLTLNTDPISPRLEIRAFAGPMSRTLADSFRRKMKTPPRGHPVQPASFRLKELSKGLETVGRNLTESMHLNWKEYWPFLDTFTDFRTIEGLNLLENFLKDKYDLAQSNIIEESIQTLKSPNCTNASSTVIGSVELSPVKEDLTPISDLCLAFKSCNINSNSKKYQKRPRRISDGYRKYNEDTQAINQTVNQLLCIERTCQVFAKRIADSLNYALSMEPERASDSFKSDLKLLQNTIFSYMHDERFRNIDFNLIHSRLSQLVVFNIRQSDELDIVPTLKRFLNDLNSIVIVDDLYSSDEDEKPTYRHLSKPKEKGFEIVKCVASMISDMLLRDIVVKGPLCSSEECGSVWASQLSCGCAKSSVESDVCRSPLRGGSFRARKLRFDREKAGNCISKSLNNSPSGDGQVPLRLEIHNSLNLDPLLSEDNTESSDSDGDENYETARDEDVFEMDDEDNLLDDEDDLMDASDQGAVDVYIYGESPSKMDRLVYDAINDVTINPEKHPYTYRWRHGITHLYTAEERESWPPAPLDSESIESPIKYTLTLGQSSPRHSTPRRTNYLTPTKTNSLSITNSNSGTIPLQVTKWLRVTGPNTPRKVLEGKNVDHNVSFGF